MKLALCSIFVSGTRYSPFSFLHDTWMIIVVLMWTSGSFSVDDRMFIIEFFLAKKIKAKESIKDIERMCELDKLHVFMQSSTSKPSMDDFPSSCDQFVYFYSPSLSVTSAWAAEHISSTAPQQISDQFCSAWLRNEVQYKLIKIKPQEHDVPKRSFYLHNALWLLMSVAGSMFKLSCMG